jgi:hypothetical protein
MIAKTPNFKRIQSILAKCAHSVFGSELPSQISNDVKGRTAALRAAWIIQRGPLTKWFVDPGPVREMIKIVYRFFVRGNAS